MNPVASYARPVAPTERRTDHALRNALNVLARRISAVHFSALCEHLRGSWPKRMRLVVSHLDALDPRLLAKSNRIVGNAIPPAELDAIVAFINETEPGEAA